jgi:hypothetical protein
MSAKRTDSNQAVIVKALRQFGASVKDIHTIGGSFDILVGYFGKDYKFEIKSPGGRLTKDEVEFHKSWRGSPVYVIHTFEEAIEIIIEEE